MTDFPIIGRNSPVHELKTAPPEWEAVDLEIKTADVRLNDRNYQRGDLLFLREWDGRTVDPGTQVEAEGRYTGRACWRKVSHVMTGGKYGLEPGYVLLSFSPLRLHPPTPRPGARAQLWAESYV